MAVRTILVNASFGPSLIEFRGHLLRRMVAAGHRVHVTAPTIDTGLRERLLAIGVTPHEVPLERTGLDLRSDLRYRGAVRQLMKRHSIDLVLGYTIKPCIWGSLAAGSLGIESASLVTGLGYAFMPQNGLRHRLVSAVSRRLWRTATKANRVVIFQNPDDRRDFIAAGALGNVSKARLVDGSGVDLEHYAPLKLPEAPVFLMIARLLGNKGVREYAQAARALLAQGLKARFMLVGYHDEGPDGIDYSELNRWCAEGLEYLGPRDDVRHALAECSIFVLPSYREGTPRTVLEAMATGRAIITSDAPGCRETIVHGESGLLVPPRDFGALAAAIRRLAEEDGLRKRMAEAARRRCVEKYDVQKINDDMFHHLEIAGAGRSDARRLRTAAC